MARFFFLGALRNRLPSTPFFDRLAWRTEAGLTRLFWWLARLLPVDAASASGGFLGRLIGPHLPKHKAVLGNIKIAFRNRDAAQQEEIARRTWGEAGRVMLEFALMDRICGSEAEKRLEIVFHHDPSLARTGERPIMYITAHLANWEIAAVAAMSRGIPLSIVSRAQHNRLIEASLRRYRQAVACRFIPSEDSLRQLMREIAEGRSLGWAIDHRHDSGALVPFFGIEAPTATMPAILALKLHCDIVPVRVERLKGCHFRITAYEKMSFAGLEHLPLREAALELTRRINGIFEQWINEQPGQWLCFKRRWPKNIRLP